MSNWPQTGGFNPNANSYTPPSQQQGGYYPGQQQQGGYYPGQQQQGGYYPGQQQQGGYYPGQQQQGGYYPGQQQQGGYYPGQQQQGGYYPGQKQQGGYYPGQQQQGGYYPGQRPSYGGQRGGFYPDAQKPQTGSQSTQQAGGPGSPLHTNPSPGGLGSGQAPVNLGADDRSAISDGSQVHTQQSRQEPPQLPDANTGKLSPGESSTTEPAVIPKKAKGGVLSLGKKNEESSKVSVNTPKPKVSEASEEVQDKKTSAPSRSKMTPEELRQHVRSEIAKQRAQSKKEFKRDLRPHFNIVFCGHVDAGKSTISGHLLMEKGLVDQREMDKLRREAEIHHREGWEFAYVMDVSEEERSKGITRETGAAYFETEKRRVTVLDAPGHKAFVPSMIGGATQADVCVLVISSRTGEFETGFEKGGQTREHAMLVRTCGVRQMICVINKMDEGGWNKDRYDEILKKLKPFLKQNGYDEEKAKNLIFIPVAGLTGDNLIKPAPPDVCNWYKGPTMMDFVDDLVLPESKSEDDVFCIPLVGSYRDEGRIYIYGKVESGSIAVGEKVQILPAKTEALVEGISIESTEFEKCFPGDNVHLRVRGVDENDVHAGYIATSIPTSLRAVEYFQARVVILDVKNIICAGSRVMLHTHAAQEEATFHKLLAKVDKRTGEVLEKDPTHVKAGDVVIARIELERSLVVEPHKEFDKLGRFMLREEGKTIAIGLIMKLYESTKESLSKAGKA